MKELGKQALQSLGFEARRVQPPGSALRPIGNLVSVLQDLHARGFRPATIFDVGASDGAWTRLVKPIFPEAAFVLVEPRPAMQDALQALSQSESNVQVAECAAGSQTGQALLTDWDTGSTLLPVAAGSAARIPVAVDTLDNLARRFAVPDVVKLDVEGFEIEALEGAQALFGAVEMFIIEVALFTFEQRPTLDEVVAYMRERNYFVYDIAGFIRRPKDGALGLVDLCFARRGGMLRRDEASW